MKTSKLLAVLVLMAAAAQAQPAHLVRDLRMGEDFDQGSAPRQFRTLGGKVLFVAHDLGSGAEVWVSDGTAGGTTLLADVCPGPCSSEPVILGTANKVVLWLASSSGDRYGRRLWRSDGTRAGTFPLGDSSQGVEDPQDEGSIAFAGNFLYYKACDEECQLWRTDGTVAGTGLVADVIPGEPDSVASLGAVGGTVFFVAGYQFDDNHLWKSDGTPGGTVPVAGLESRPFLAAATSQRFFFVRFGEEQSQEVWTSDGTAAGTVRLVSFPEPPDSFGSEILWLKTIGNRVYFVADDVIHGQEIWTTDGTAAGTRRVTDFPYHAPFPNGLQEWQIEEIAGRLVFLATDGLSEVKLWSSAGSSLTPLARICSGSFSCDHIDFDWRLARTGDRIVFRGTDAEHGLELWSTNGTAAGTQRLNDACPGVCDGLTAHPVAAGRFVYAAAWSGLRHELWRTNGAAAGTRRFARLSEEFFDEIERLEIAVAGRTVFFSAPGLYGEELWSSDGTAAGTGVVTDIYRAEMGSDPRELVAFKDGIVFSACADDGHVWFSAGTEATTTPLAISEHDFCLPDYQSREIAAGAGRVFFFFDDGNEWIWSTDGTAAGTSKVVLPGYGGSRPQITRAVHQDKVILLEWGLPLAFWKTDGTPAGTALAYTLPEEIVEAYHVTAVGNDLYFVGVKSFDADLWKLDGNTGAFRQLTEGHRLERYEAPQITRFGSSVYFLSDGNLWKTDGTPEGTAPVSEDIFRVSGFTAHGDSLYFFGRGPGGVRALWRSNATGTTMVRSFVETSSFDDDPEFLTVFQGRLFFSADDGVHGRELWESDGTPDGTRQVLDIHPGPEPSRPSDLKAAGGRLFFAAHDGVHGNELWESDGTPGGTRLRHDIAPQAQSSAPASLTESGGRLYFTADDGLTGREVWSLPLGAAMKCQSSSTVLCLGGGRFKVEAVWADFDGNTGTGRAVPLSADTGYFWFFNAENIEVVVKVLDGHGVNGHHWVFYGALSNVEYDLTVTDTETGLTRRYFNPVHRFASVGDTYGFGPLGAFKTRTTSPASPEPVVKERFDPAAATGVCAPSTTRLCLNGGRFAVEVSWKDFSNRTGMGTAVNLTPDTGYFWFFNAANVELVVKVLDGRNLNGKFWVFYGALSNVEYTLTVTDTQTGKIKDYKNPLGRFGSAGDTGAF